MILDFGYYHLTVGYRQRQGRGFCTGRRLRERQRLRNAKGKAYANSTSFGFWIESHKLQAEWANLKLNRLRSYTS